MSRETTERTDLDVVVVGAGFSGLYALYRLRGLGLRVRVFERGEAVGGTWYWNRYPGARCDVASLDYSFGFDEDLQQEWEWTEVMPSQPEVERYLNHVADRFDLRRDIQLNTTVTAAHFDDAEGRWTIALDTGDRVTATWCVMATGCLSVPLTPEIEGVDSFAGEVYHTGRWPKEPVDLTGKRVAIIGTGSSGVQTIPEVAPVAEHLLVFQRTPTYTFPSRNKPLDPEYQRRIKEDYAGLRQRQRESFAGIATVGLGGALMNTPSQKILETTPEERRRALDELGWDAIRQYADIHTDPEANELACEMYREMVRRVVKDPETAEALSPRGYPLGCKRPVVDQGYFETFNRDNVTLVDLRRGGIEAITPSGVRTANAEYAVDVIILATGFDAMTGALNRIDIRGRDGLALREKWADGPRAYLGLQSAGFPNLFLITGPQSPSVLSNMVVSIEQHVEWITDCITYLRDNGVARIEPSVEAEDEWVEHVNSVAAPTMLTAPSCNSWYLGANVPGKPRIFMPYVGGVGNYRRRCEEIAAKGYEGFILTPARDTALSARSTERS